MDQVRCTYIDLVGWEELGVGAIHKVLVPEEKTWDQYHITTVNLLIYLKVRFSV